MYLTKSIDNKSVYLDKYTINFWSVLTAYFGFLVSTASPMIAAVFLILSIFLSCFGNIFSNKIFPLFLLILIIIVFKISYYFLLLDNLKPSLEFFSREGRFILSLALLAAFSMIRLGVKDVIKLAKACRILFLCWLPIYVVNFLGVNLLEASHHQRGSVIISGFVWQFLISIYSDKTRFSSDFLIMSIICAACVLISGSRVSIIGFLLISFFPLFKQYFIRASLAAIISLALILVFFEGRIEVGERKFDLSVIESIPAAMAYGATANSLSHASDFSDSGIATTDFNVTARFAMFARSFVRFTSSPLLGIGVGRFDDFGSFCSSAYILVCIHDQGFSNYAGNTAHNVFLHILVEEGLLGFFLLCLLLRMILRTCQNSLKASGHDMFIHPVVGIWFYMAISGFFNHILASPLFIISLFLPLILISQISYEPKNRV